MGHFRVEINTHRLRSCAPIKQSPRADRKVSAVGFFWPGALRGANRGRFRKRKKSYAKASRKRWSARSLAEKMARRGVDVAGVFSKTVLNSNGLERRVSRTQDGSQRQEQGKRRVWQGNEAVMPVESRCRLVLGVHHQGEGGNLRTGGTVERIGQQSTT